MADGRLAPAKGRLLVRAVNDRTRDAFVRDEEMLIETLAGLTVDEAAQVVRLWQRLADQDGPDPRDRDQNALWLSQTQGGRWSLKGDLDLESGTVLFDVLSGFVADLRRERRERGEDLHGMGPRLRAEGLLEMARRSTAADDANPASRPLVWVIASDEQLRTGKGVCELAGGGAISALTAQRLACDCDLAKVLIDPKGNRINLGRSQRTASGTQRRLLWMRDGGCRFPGCGRPPGWCEAHHVVWWDNDGATDLDNLALLCSYHHHLCHEGGYRAVRQGNDLVFFRPDGTTLDPPAIAA